MGDSDILSYLRLYGLGKLSRKSSWECPRTLRCLDKNHNFLSKFRVITWMNINTTLMNWKLITILLGGKDTFTKAVRHNSNRRQIEMQKAVEQLPSLKECKPGEFVYLWDKKKDNQHRRKLDPVWRGPYFIKAAISNGSYTLEQWNGRIVGNGIMYNHSHLKRAYKWGVLVGYRSCCIEESMDCEYKV